MSIAGIANQLCKGEDMLSTEANEPEDIVNSKKMNAGKGESVDRKELITERCFEKTLWPMGHIVEFSDF